MGWNFHRFVILWMCVQNRLNCKLIFVTPLDIFGGKPREVGMFREECYIHISFLLYGTSLLPDLFSSSSFYSPGVLFPKKEPDDSKDEDEDEDDSSEEDSEDEEPPPKRYGCVKKTKS